MAQDLIDHYIDREGIRQDTEFILAELNKVLAELTKLVNTKFSLGDASGFRATAKAAKEAQDSIDALTRSQDRLVKAELQAEKIKQARIKTDNEVIKQLQLEEKAEQQIIKTKKEKLTYEQALQREREKGASQAAAEAKLAEQLSNDYLQLNKALKDAELRYKNLYLSGQGNTQAAKEALQTALSYRKILDDVDSKLGNFQRNVGNYASGFKGLNNSVQQILREAPSAAINLNTFFLAISNNLPILFDEIQRAKAQITETNLAIKEAAALARVDAEAKALQAGATAELAAAEGLMAEKTALANAQQGKAPSVLQQLGKSIFSLQSLLSAGVLILTLYGGKFIDWISSLFKAEKGLDSFAEKQKRSNGIMEEAKDAYVKATLEVSNLKIAFEQARSGIIKKEEAVKLYNDTIGKTTGEIKTLDEAEKSLARNADAYIQFTFLKAAANIALQKSAEKAVEAQLKQFNPESPDLLDKLGNRLKNNKTGFVKNLLGIQDFTQTDEEINANIADAKRKNEKQVKELKNEEQNFKNVATDFRAQAEKIAKENKFDFNAISEPKNKSEKDKKVRESTKATLDSEFELYKIAQERKKAILQESIDDEFRSYDEKLAIAKEYYTESINLINAQEDENLRVLKEKLAAQEANLKKAKGTERNNLLVEIKNTNTQIKIAEAKANDERIVAGQKFFDDISALYDKQFEETKVRYQKEAEAFNKLQERKKQIVQDRIAQDANIQELEVLSQFEIDIKGKTVDEIIELEKKKDREIEKIDKQRQLAQLQAQELQLEKQKKYFEALNKLLGGNYFNTINIENLITENKAQQSKIRSGITKEEVNNEEKDRNELIDKIYKYEQEAASVVEALVLGQNQRQKNDIQQRIELTEKEKNDKIRAINELFISDKEKAEKIAVVEAVAQAKKEQLEQRQRRLDLERARFEKAKNISDIILNTLVEVIKAGGPLTPKGLQLSIFGALALAKAIATPLPKFKGGKDKNNNYEGFAYVDDGGKNEPILREDGTIEMSTGTPKDRITYLKKNDIVFPSLDAMMKQMNVLPKIIPVKDNAVDQMGDFATRLENAIASINIKTTSITKEGWREHNRRLEEYNSWVNKTIKN